MKGLNKVTLIGNLGNDPEMRVLENGWVVAKFSLATTEVYRQKNGDIYNDTQWHRVILWRSLAELAVKYLKRGSRIYLEGRVRNREYVDKEGIKRYITEIVADKFIMLDKRDAKANQETANLFDDPISL